MIFSCNKCGSSTLDRAKRECAHCGGSYIEEPSFTPPNFQGAKVMARVFRGEDLRCANFAGAALMEVTFVNCRLQGACFKNATLMEVAFRSCDTRDMNMQGSTQMEVTGL